MGFDPYYRWLGIPPKEQPPHHYRLLGVAIFESSADVIEAAADRQMVHLRSYQSGEHSELSQKLLNEVSAARVCLLNPEKKAAYDRGLRKQLKARQKPIPKAQPLASKEPKKPADAGLEQLFEKTGPAPSLGRKAALRSKQTQLWASAGIVAVGIVALIVVLIRAGGSSNDNESTSKGPTPVAQSKPTKPPKLATPPKNPPIPEKPQPATPVKDTSAETPKPVPGNGPAPPPAVAPFDAAKAREHQEAWARYLGAPVEGVNSIGMKFVLIPPGEFEMGSTDEEVAHLLKDAARSDGPVWYGGQKTAPKWCLDRVREEAPRHHVKITKPLGFGMYEVTQEQYERVMGENPSQFHGHPSLPVDQVTWQEAVEFCRRLSEMASEKAARAVYRLPTEAEWEYACRAGTVTRYSFGDASESLGRYAWWGGNAHKRTHAVGQLRPNPWGAFDMLGNVWEWCADGYSADYYEQSPENDPCRRDSGVVRMLRGGAKYYSHPALFRCACRTVSRFDTRDHNFGFRVACEPAVAALKPVQPPGTATAQNPATPKPVTVEEPRRLPVPADEQRQAVATQLAEIYKLKNDRKPDEQKAQAAELIGLAKKSQTPAERYVLLVTAAELFGRAGEAAAMLRAVDTLAEAFDVDAVAEKAALVKGLAGQAKDSAAIGAMLDAADPVIDAAIEQEKYDVALELAEEAYKACAQGAGREHRKRAYDRRKQVQAVAASWQKLQAVLEKLKADPDDPAANLAVGRHWCFEQGDWAKGLPLLAKGSDAELKKLAGQELESPPADSKAMLQLADAWWALSESRQDDERTALMLRAGTWYREAQPEISSTLVKAKLAKRLAAIAKLGEAIPELAPTGPPAPGVAPFGAAQAKRHQERWAKHLGLPAETTNSIGMKLVLIPPGEFMMGTSNEEIERLIQESESEDLRSWYPGRVRAEGPRHRVRISRAFYMGKFEVTQEQYSRLMGEDADRDGDAATLPVGNVSWNQSLEFCKRLSARPDRSVAGGVYRLPTEAEWEYSCRAGTTTRFAFGNEADPKQLSLTRGKLSPVGSFPPNAWGLFDMHGSIWEWCGDGYAADYYVQPPTEDPGGPMSPAQRILRGGGYTSQKCLCRSAFRGAATPTAPVASYGFRVVYEIGDGITSDASRIPQP